MSCAVNIVRFAKIWSIVFPIILQYPIFMSQVYKAFLNLHVLQYLGMSVFFFFFSLVKLLMIQDLTQT